MTNLSDDSFPRQYARTQRFTLGAPRSFTIAPDGSRVVFVRSRGGSDRVGCLWAVDVGGATLGQERLVVDPQRLLAAGPAGGVEELSAQERARRERSREGAAGIVAYSTDDAVRRAAFALSGRLWLADLLAGGARQVPSATPVVDPRLDPTGRYVGYVAAGALRVVDVGGGAGSGDSNDRVVAEPDDADVTWGLAEFVAAEEMGRHQGFWWAPDGSALLAARVDNAPVQRWWIADPAQPGTGPTEIAYPAAGTANADVTLALIRVGDAGASGRGPGTPVRPVDIGWDRERFPYLASVHWTRHGPPLLQVQSRDQRTVQILAVDLATGATMLIREDSDPVWLDLVPGVPAWLPDGRLLRTVDVHEGGADARRLAYDDTLVTPPTLQVDAVLSVDADGVLVRGTEEATERHLWHVSLTGEIRQLTSEPGLHAGRGAVGGSDLLVVTRSGFDDDTTRAWLERDGERIGELPSYAERPLITPRVSLLRAGERELRTAVLLPTGWEPGRDTTGKLPVLMDPYGGPHVQRAVAARGTYLSSQWFADQGFAVIVADGRGTPGRGPAWERSVAFDMAEPVLEDQVAALHAVAEKQEGLDLDRVAIRGWSFGGYLAALAVLRRPDVFAAAIAGAPVTDWALYDTHYTERYLGLPQEHPEVYARCNLLADAGKLTRPLLLVHGLADDNVVAAHTLQLSAALLAAGRPHQVLPLSGVTHMTPQEVVAENLLLLQVAFLRQALGS